nr:hypothetical protein [Candidatus Sigynarchaeota archaeon]
MAKNRVDLDEASRSVIINDMVINDIAVFGTAKRIPPEKRVEKVIRAVTLGLFAIEHRPEPGTTASTKTGEKCVVCENTLKGTTYVCPEYETKYCIRCAVALSQREESCWTCKKPLRFD